MLRKSASLKQTKQLCGRVHALRFSGYDLEPDDITIRCGGQEGPLRLKLGIKILVRRNNEVLKHMPRPRLVDLRC